MNSRVGITITETTVYYREVDLDELEAVAKVKLGECDGDLDLLLECVRESRSDEALALLERLERHGDVQGQQWSGEFVDDEVGPTAGKEHDNG
jgi:hypothetical protein